MRNIIVLEHISLDGLIQVPGRPDEDPSGSFAYGGWISPYSDEIGGTVLRRQMNLPFDLLVGRTTIKQQPGPNLNVWGRGYAWDIDRENLRSCACK